MKKSILFVAVIFLIFACDTPYGRRQATQPTPAPPVSAVTRPAGLGGVASLMLYFESQHAFECAPSGNHFRCTAPDSLVKVVFFGDPVNEATMSLPFEAVKPSKYALALLQQTGLPDSAWDWLVSEMKAPEASRVFGDRRLTTQMDSEGWLVTVEWVK